MVYIFSTQNNMYENSFESKIYDTYLQTWKHKIKISDNKSLHHCITLHLVDEKYSNFSNLLYDIPSVCWLGQRKGIQIPNCKNVIPTISKGSFRIPFGNVSTPTWTDLQKWPVNQKPKVVVVFSLMNKTSCIHHCQ